MLGDGFMQAEVIGFEEMEVLSIEEQIKRKPGKGSQLKGRR